MSGRSLLPARKNLAAIVEMTASLLEILRDAGLIEHDEHRPIPVSTRAYRKNNAVLKWSKWERLLNPSGAPFEFPPTGSAAGGWREWEKLHLSLVDLYALRSELITHWGLESIIGAKTVRISFEAVGAGDSGQSAQFVYPTIESGSGDEIGRLEKPLDWPPPLPLDWLNQCLYALDGIRQVISSESTPPEGRDQLRGQRMAKTMPPSDTSPAAERDEDSCETGESVNPPLEQTDNTDLAPLFSDALDRVVVVEDDSDATYILWWMKKILPAEQWEQLSARRFFLNCGGRPTGDEVNQQLDTIRQIHPEERNLQPKAFVVADRDFRLDEELAGEYRKLQGKSFSRQTWHVWQRVEIENFLVLRDALRRYILEQIAAAGPGSGREHVTEQELRALIEEAIEASRPAVRKQMIDSFQRCRRGSMASTIVTEAEQFLDSVWRDDNKPAWCDAKEVVLPRLKEALKTRWNLALPEQDFIASLRPEEIPEEIRQTIVEIAKFLVRARWTRSSPTERAAIQPFIEALKSTAPDIRQKAAEALGTKGRAAVPALARALLDESPEVRMSAVESLTRIGHDAVGATDALVSALEDRDASIQERAATALGGIGPGAASAVPALVAAIRQDQWRLRCQAAAALGKIGVVDGAVPALIEAVRDRQVPARDVAAQALGDIGVGAAAAVGDLVAALAEDDSPVRAAAAVALGKIGTASEEVLQGLQQALQHEDASVRRAAAEGFGALGPDAAPAAATLVALLEDRDEQCRRAAAEAIGKVRLVSRNEVAALVRTLCDGAWSVRQLAAGALGRIGLVAKEAAPTLMRLAEEDENAVVRIAAASALALVGGDSQFALSVLIRGLEGPNDAARKAAAETLGELGGMAIPAVPALAAVLTDRNWWVRFAAAETLGKLGPAATSSVAALTAAFTDDYVEPPSAGRMSYGDGPIYDLIRHATALALGRIGGAAAPALPVLRNARGYQKVVQAAVSEAIRLIEQCDAG